MNESLATGLMPANHRNVNITKANNGWIVNVFPDVHVFQTWDAMVAFLEGVFDDKKGASNPNP